MVPLDEVALNPKNRNKHPKDQIERLAEIIRYQGFRDPITISNRSGFCPAGEGRVLAARLLKLTHIPVIYQDFDSEEQEIAHGISDNAIAAWANLDMPNINVDVGDLGPHFDINMLGLKDFEIEVADKTAPGEEDHVPPPPKQPKSKTGDLFIIGGHRLLCGDSTNIQAIEYLMDGERADMVFTDPPYNVDYSNADRPKAGKKDFGRIENDKMDSAKFLDFLREIFSCLDIFTKDNSTLYMFFAGTTVPFYVAIEESNFQFNQLLIWKKPMLLGRSRYQWAHEPCLFGIKGSPYFTEDRTKTTVWDFGGYDKSKNVHPTQKPIVVIEEAIKNSSKVGDFVLDLFGGSGSTIIACEKTKRSCFTSEIDPKYCDVILNRWCEFTGEEAYLREENGNEIAWSELSR